MATGNGQALPVGGKSCQHCREEEGSRLTLRINVRPDAETREVLGEAVQLSGRPRCPSEVLQPEGSAQDDGLSDVDNLGAEAGVPAPRCLSSGRCPVDEDSHSKAEDSVVGWIPSDVHRRRVGEKVGILQARQSSVFVVQASLSPCWLS